MYLKEITLRNIKCFADVTLRFPPPGAGGNWCVLLGDNGTGKTTLLQAIALTLVGPGSLLPDPTSWIAEHGDTAECEATFVLPSGVERRTSYTIRRSAKTLFDQGQAFTRVDPLTGDDVTSPFVLAGYGALRRMQFGPGGVPVGKADVADALATLFSPEKGLRNFDRLIQTFDYMAKDTDLTADDRRVYEYLRNRLLDTIDSLLPSYPPFRVNGVNSAGVTFSAPGGQQVALSDVSEGYRNVFALSGDLIARCIVQTQMQELPPSINTPGIVLIDEVDAHLHPKWQRMIGKSLQKVFPNIQFIVATHSPFVAQAAGEGGMSALRWENDIVQAESPLPSMHALSAEEILLGPAFGLDTTRDPEIDAQLREYVRLHALDLRGQLKPEDRKRIKELKRRLKGAIPAEGNVYDTHTEVDMLLREAEKDHD